MKEATQKALVFVNRSGLQFFSSTSRTIASLPFDQKVVRDLDVIDPAALSAQIGTFVIQNKLTPSLVMFVFSEGMCFYQDFSETDESKLKLLLQEFVNNVPFETVLTKVYKTKNGVRVVSINDRLYREVASVFQSKGFVSLGVIPSLVLGGKMGLANSLDAALAGHVLTNIENLREQSLFAVDAESGNEEEKNSSKAVIKTGFKITRNAVILAVVFVLLLGVLVYLLVR